MTKETNELRLDSPTRRAYMKQEVEQRTVGEGRKAGLPGELWHWTGVEIAHGIRTRLISSREAVESCLARIEQTNPRLNALVEVSPDEAVDMADSADRAVAAGKPLGPLHGVPISIKVNSDQAGHATTDGLVALKDNIAEAVPRRREDRRCRSIRFLSCAPRRRPGTGWAGCRRGVLRGYQPFSRVPGYAL